MAQKWDGGWRGSAGETYYATPHGCWMSTPTDSLRETLAELEAMPALVAAAKLEGVVADLRAEIVGREAHGDRRIFVDGPPWTGCPTCGTTTTEAHSCASVLL